MRLFVKNVIIVILCINVFNFSRAFSIGTVSDQNPRPLKEKDVEKREAKPNGDGEFYPDWVPFKNKHGDELGEFEQIKKSRPKKRLALPLNFAFVRPPREARANEDYYDKNLDSEDYYEKRDWSDITRQDQPSATKKAKNRTKDRKKNGTPDKKDSADIDIVINILQDAQPSPYLNKINTNNNTNKIKEANQKKTSKEKDYDEEEEDYDDVKKITTTEKTQPTETTKTEEELKKEAEQKEKVFKEVDELKARHAKEQKKIMSEITNEDAIFEEEFERENQYTRGKSPYLFSHPKAKKLMGAPEENSDVEDLFIDKYEMPYDRSKKRKTTTRQISYEDAIVTEMPEETVKIPESKEEYEYVDIGNVNTTIKTTTGTTTTKEEEERIMLVPEKESQDGEPTLFFARKKKNKPNKKDRITKPSGIKITTAFPTEQTDATVAASSLSVENSDSVYTHYPVEKASSPTVPKITGTTVLSNFKGDFTKKMVPTTPSASSTETDDSDVEPSSRGTALLSGINEPSASSTGPSASATGPSASDSGPSTSDSGPSASDSGPSANGSGSTAKTVPSGAEALEKILTRLYHTPSPKKNMTLNSSSTTNRSVTLPSSTDTTDKDASSLFSTGFSVTSPLSTSSETKTYTSLTSSEATAPSDTDVSDEDLTLPSAPETTSSAATTTRRTTTTRRKTSKSLRQKPSGFGSEKVEAAASVNRQSLLDPLVAASDHKKKEDDGEDKEYKKGGGKEYHAEQEEEHSEHGKKAYEHDGHKFEHWVPQQFFAPNPDFGQTVKTKKKPLEPFIHWYSQLAKDGSHKNTKSAKGHHEKEDHHGDYHDHGGVDKKHHDESGHYGSHHHEEAGKKHAKYEESGKHSKGHSTKGSHDVHKKEEYEKKVEFFEEEGDSGEQEKSGGFHTDKSNSQGGKYKKGNLHSNHEHVDLGKGGYFAKGGSANGFKGHKSAAGDDSHSKHGHSHFLKGGKEGSKKWIFHHGYPPKNANLVVIDRRGDQWQHGPVYYG